MVLMVKFRKLSFPVTFDNGATVSFMRVDLARALGLKFKPNGQLASLADSRYRIKSLGEVNFIVTEVSTGKALLRIRALIMENLAVPCYGGQTFQLDNGACADISKVTISLHGGRFLIYQGPYTGPPAQPPPKQSIEDLGPPVPPPAQSVEEAAGHETVLQSTSITTAPPPSTTKPMTAPETILMKAPKFLIPSATYQIPLKGNHQEAVLILPPPPKIPAAPSPDWPPSICPVVSGCAIYTNNSQMPISHPKNSHFRAVPLQAISEVPPSLPPAKCTSQPSIFDPQDLLTQFQINTSALSPSQLQKLSDLHLHHIKVFDGDLTEGYTNAKDPYEASFTFKKESMAPPFKIWCPEYNTRCKDLMQAVCDKLENQGILKDPKSNGVTIRTVSPCMIRQKARAKHKPLDQCAVSEVRFITCFNGLNDYIHPISGRSDAYNEIIKFLGRYKFFIFADLVDSYFQVRVEKKLWKYLAVMTPYRGIKVLTRLGQGLLNSDVELDQVMRRTLGDEITAGFCMAARDDLCVGGDTIDEAIEKWGAVLSKLDKCNLKLSPKKVRIFLEDAEIFGHRVKDGKVSPSNHIVNSLGKTTIAELVTVKQVNSWKGLYKTLLRHLPNLAAYMAPFDAACAGKASSSNFDWSRPGLVAAFNAAIEHLDKVSHTFLPRPSEQLVLKPDTSKSNLCSGWVLYTLRTIEGKVQWLPVQYASAKLHDYMSGWYPCELEGVGTVLAIEQVRHWINESTKPTIVLPDNKPVVDAANMMRTGRASRNARLQSLLSCVNRSNVVFRHNSAKAGLHQVPDALSRISHPPCCSKDCQVERFLEELPDKVQCMSLTLEDIALSSLDPTILASTAPMLEKLLSINSGPIPLGSRQAWLNLQGSDSDCQRFLDCKREGKLPGRKEKDITTLNKLLKKCEVDKGLIVSKVFDSIIMKEMARVYVPTTFLASILTLMHVRLAHPLPTQLQQLFERYFISFNVKATCDALSEDCSLCVALRKFPKELDDYSPSPSPEHPGSHMNVDVLKRASQLILVNCDRFSNYVTATLAPSESREDMVRAILQVVTPVRHCHRVQVRTDRAPALLSLASRPDKQLESNGINIIVGEQGNPNSNCSVDNIIKDLEAELRRQDPEGGPVDAGTLSLAVTTLNNKIRKQGFSSSQIHFSRDSHTGTNIPLQDKRLREAKMEEKVKSNPQTARSKAPKGKEHVKTDPQPGQLVYLKSDLSKHAARNPLLVTNVEKKKVEVQKVLHSTSQHQVPPRIVSQKMRIDERFLYVPPHKRVQQHQLTKHKGSDDVWWRAPPGRGRGPSVPAPPRPPWTPINPQADDDDDYALITSTWVPREEQVLENDEVPNDAGEGDIQEGEDNQEGGDGHEEGEILAERENEGEDLQGEAEEQHENEVDLLPEAHEYPPWPPAPRRRLLGISGRPMKKKSEAKIQAMDIPGRLVKIGESIKFRIPDDRGGERRRGVMSAIVVNMSRTQQEAFPDYYNLRTQDAITMSARLQPDNFWVWRREKWYPGDHPQLPEPDGIDMPSPPRDGEEQAQ